MKKQVATNTDALSGAAIARRFGVARSVVTQNWVRAGCPRNRDKTYSLAAVTAWYQQRECARVERAAERERRTELQKRKLRLQCEQLATAIARDRARFHDVELCRASIRAIVARESRILRELPARYLLAFPGQVALADWLSREVEDVIARLAAGGDPAPPAQ